MEDVDGPVQGRRGSHHPMEPAIQVICLGSGGGPNENNVTGFLVRATSTKWAKNSVLAVDAGSHMAAIIRLLAEDFPMVGTPDSEEAVPHITTLDHGPFAGLPFPNASARANALYVVREHISTFLITHPHLDHVSGFVINTAAFHNTSRPKRLAAMPSTVNAIKTHLFNNIIWPNLTDEDGGVGLVTFQRLVEGGNIALGEGYGRGYIEVCDGLSVKGFKVSHGHCMRGPGHVHRGSNANLIDSSSTSNPMQLSTPQSHQLGNITVAEDPGRASAVTAPTPQGGPQYEQCVIDSTAYFIRTEATHHTPAREILIFGDVEPDSISLSPHTHLVWSEAAPKIANGMLAGIFIECSYPDSQSDGMLFGHLVPRHLIAELQSLADMVTEARREFEREEEWRKGRKRKRASGGPGHRGMDGEKGDDRSMTDSAAPPSQHGFITHPTKPSHYSSAPSVFITGKVPVAHSRAMLAAGQEGPLKGVKVIVIHVKDTCVDGPPPEETVLEELREAERELAERGRGLGCVFEVSRGGGSYWF
ncbi:hypothetical protein GQ43DRAFT_381631 [Delitschia confertaspora ATCC 74209]|uniref:3',5'-cyclic-nucleotide phosphodiesterase n=1 Tax=Delitschia confertaspora ATCC 74209 TaxID=1513339 RepID=A0A9P4MRN4_9PLEO|nr:hypothetical protein GQ43DRAFT_381631 [Delitschia confertaspora ATCC 74209]